MDTTASKATGNALRKLRDQSALTQVDVAQRLGKPQSFVSKTESGERALRAYELIAYADALEITPQMIVAALETALESQPR